VGYFSSLFVSAHAVRRDPELQGFYRRKPVQKGLGKARMPAARKLGIRLWIMLRDSCSGRPRYRFPAQYKGRPLWSKV